MNRKLPIQSQIMDDDKLSQVKQFQNRVYCIQSKTTAG